MFKIKNRGFTLVELMVSISIFMLLTGVTLMSYPKFSNKLSLDLLAEDIALSLRQAQIFGSSVLGSKSTTAGQTKTFGAYGIHFEKPTATNPYAYLLFADIDNQAPQTMRKFNIDPPETPIDQNLTCGSPTFPDNECVQKFLISGRNKLVAMCANYIRNNVQSQDRVTNCLGNPLNSLDIVFVRPNLDARFTAFNDAGEVKNFSNIGLVLESPNKEYYKTIVVWKTGQISVE